MSNWAVLIILLQIIAIAIVQSQLAYYYIALEGIPCVTVLSGIYVNGCCTTIGNCPSVLSDVLNHIYGHNLCGYIGRTPFVCCPIEHRPVGYHQLANWSEVNHPEDKDPIFRRLMADDTEPIQQIVKTNLRYDVECKMANSNEIGVMKFVSECPELNINDTIAEHDNKLCDFEVCADLVCCPVQHKHRLKKVCSKVDDPIDTLELRLLRNQKCTVKDLNMKGVYQRRCDFAERNPSLKSLLQKVCNDFVCSGWYCCPIEDVDRHVCTESEISSSIATFVGPKCVDSRSGRNGTCKIIRDCPHSRENSSTLDKCGTHCYNDYYCCPDVELFNLSRSAEACLSYTKFLQKEIIQVPMDLNVNKIIQGTLPSDVGVAGGFLTEPGGFPHMAALGYGSKNEISWKCGGSLISDRYVVTAAHCISIRAGCVKKVRLGVVDLLNDVKTADCPEEYDVVRQITHPEYKPRFLYNDIGLIELDGQVKFNFHIRPLCLPISSDIPKNFISMGWGDIGPMTENKSSKLLFVHQTLFPHEECDEFYRNNTIRKMKNNQGILNETQICAGSRESIQSTCTGDSGGPLLDRDSKYFGLFVIYGVVSFGLPCGSNNTPGIYIKVYPYLEWIEGVVWNN